MTWDYIDGDLNEYSIRAKQQWAELSEAQLANIAGRRALLADGIEETYGITTHAAQWPLSGWQQRQHPVTAKD